MNSRKLIRLAILIILLGVGVYLYYHQSIIHRILPQRAEEKELATRLAQSDDLSFLTPQSVPDHIKALSDKDAAARQKAAKALWQIGPYAKAATPALLAALKDSAPEVREMAARALGPVSEGTPDAVPALADALKDPQAG